MINTAQFNLITQSMPILQYADASIAHIPPGHDAFLEGCRVGAVC